MACEPFPLSAKVVVEGVGLPPVWRCSWPSSLTGNATSLTVTEESSFSPLPEGAEVLLDHPPTYFGLLRQLALWTGDKGEAQAYWLEWDGRWSLWSYGGHAGRKKLLTYLIPAVPPYHPNARAKEALVAILSSIGRGEVSR